MSYVRPLDPQPAPLPAGLSHDDVTKHVRQAILPDGMLDVLPGTVEPTFHLNQVPQGYVSRATPFPTNSGVLTPILWDSLDLAISGCVLLSTGIAVPVPGAYLVTFSTLWAIGANGAREALLYINSSTATPLAVSKTAPYTGDVSTSFAHALRLSAGDIVTPNTYQDSGAVTNLLATGYTRMSVVFLSN